MEYQLFYNVDDGISQPYTVERKIYADNDEQALDKARYIGRVDERFYIGDAWLMFGIHEISLFDGRRFDDEGTDHESNVPAAGGHGFGF
jgi:hypothetical protein